jgi:hypothetical protein
MFYCKELNIEENTVKTIKLNYYRKLLFYAFNNIDRDTASKAIAEIKNINNVLNIKDWLKYLGSKNVFAHNFLKTLVKL